MVAEIAKTFPFPRIEKLDLSHSSRSTFRSCARKLEFRKIYNNSRRSEGLASGAGSALHAGIQSWMQHYDFDAAMWELIRAFPIKYQKSWSDANSLAGCYKTLESMMNWEKLDQFELAKITKPDGTIVPGVEVPFTLRISNYPFYPDGGTICVDYIGYIDLVLYDKLNDSHVVWDIKTTTKDVDHTVSYKFSDQCLPYGVILESILGHEIADGFEVGYWSVKIDPVNPVNKYYPFHKTKTDLRDWMQGYLFDLDQIRTFYNLGWFPRNGNSCMAWNRPCSFFDFCETRDPKVIEVMLEADTANQHAFERQDPWIVVELDYKVAA